MHFEFYFEYKTHQVSFRLITNMKLQYEIVIIMNMYIHELFIINKCLLKNQITQNFLSIIHCKDIFYTHCTIKSIFRA